MILYGNLISNYTRKNNIPVPYRVQECKNNTSKYKINNSENDILNNFLTKKSLGKSYYSIYPENHASLGLNNYIHATSPIGDTLTC